jgi:hypothetical protein
MAASLDFNDLAECVAQAERLNPFRCPGYGESLFQLCVCVRRTLIPFFFFFLHNSFVCVDGNFRRFQVVSSKFQRIRNSRKFDENDKRLHLLWLALELPGAETVTLYPFDEDVPLLKNITESIDVLFNKVDQLYRSVSVGARSRGSKSQSELLGDSPKNEHVVTELVNLLIETKAFVTCQDLLQFSSAATRERIIGILFHWYQQHSSSASSTTTTLQSPAKVTLLRSSTSNTSTPSKVTLQRTNTRN